MSIHERSLPGGQRVWSANRRECDFLYDEIFRQQVYWRHPVPGNGRRCVVDVGAHIGLFSLFVSTRLENAEIFAFEPAPRSYRLLCRNALRHFPRAILSPEALAARDGIATFHEYEKAAGWSTLHPDEETVRESLFAHLGQAPRGPAQKAFRMLGKVAPGTQRRWFDRIVRGLLSSRRTVSCRTRRLSGIIAERAIERIDLLKVDVEGAEIDVLDGIEPEHWPRIDRIAMETQVSDEATAALAARIRGHGFEVEVRQLDSLRGTPYRCLAARSSANRPVR